MAVMMAEQSSSTKSGEKQLFNKLDKAAIKLEEINKKPQAVSQDFNELIAVLQQFNASFDQQSFWEDKKLTSEGMDQKIGEALSAIQLFKNNYYPKEAHKAGQRDVEQAIISLFSALNLALSIFDNNLKGLSKYKIGQRVEKTTESKHS